eukprot:1810216-Alexandrium_andersonii.AAC.1
MRVGPARAPPGPCPRVLQRARQRLGSGHARKRGLSTPRWRGVTARRSGPPTRRIRGWRRS